MTTLERLQTVIAENYSVQREALTPDARLEDLQIDSLGVMELFFSIEDEFGIKVPNDRVNLETLAQVVEYIDALVVQQHGTRPATGALP